MSPSLEETRVIMIVRDSSLLPSCDRFDRRLARLLSPSQTRAETPPICHISSLFNDVMLYKY